MIITWSSELAGVCPLFLLLAIAHIMDRLNKERKKKYAEKCICSGRKASFIPYDAWYSVVELRDIPDEVDEIRFSMRSYELSDIKMPRKQYPNVKIIHIGSDVKRLNIPNSMFPNVEHVISEGNPIFESGSMLITNERETGLKMRILKNTFCKKPEDM